MKNISSNVIINTSVGLPFTLSGASRKTLLDNSNYELTVEKVKLKAANKKIAARMATEEDTKKAINVKLKKLKQIEERFHMLRLKAITTRADTIKLAMAVVLYQIKNARCTESLAAAQLKERSSRVEAEALKKVALSSAKHERKVAKELVNRKYALEIRRVKKLLKETLLRIEKEENKQTEMLAETSSKTKIICKPDAPKSLKKWGPSNPFAVFVTESKYSSMKDLALRWKALSKSDQKPFIVKAEANLAMKRKVKSKMQSRSRKRNTWTSYVKENFTTAYKDAREVIPDRIAAFSSASSVVAAKFREEKENNQKSNINTKRKKRKIRIDPTPRLKK